MNIRQAEKSDLKALRELAVTTWSQAFGHTFSTSDLANHIEENLSETYFNEAIDKDVFLIAEIGNCMIGFVQFGDLNVYGANLKNAMNQELRRIYVLADFQNQGIGRLLMDAALAHSRLKNARNIYLDVWEHNLGAQKFYKRYGFEIIGERKLVVPSGAQTDLDLIMLRSSST